MDVLEAVAWDMRMLGAVYVHTDGYIFPHRDLAADAIDTIRERYGLVGTPRANGPGTVAGLGRWKIGEISHGNQDLGRQVDSMTEPPGTLADELAEWCKSSQIPASPAEEVMA